MCSLDIEQLLWTGLTLHSFSFAPPLPISPAFLFDHCVQNQCLCVLFLTLRSHDFCYCCWTLLLMYHITRVALFLMPQTFTDGIAVKSSMKWMLDQNIWKWTHGVILSQLMGLNVWQYHGLMKYWRTGMQLVLHGCKESASCPRNLMSDFLEVMRSMNWGFLKKNPPTIKNHKTPSTHYVILLKHLLSR